MWIDVRDALPLVGERVIVKGDFAQQEDFNELPIAWVNSPEREKIWGLWDSKEWRGTVAVRFWWKDDEQ